MSDTHDAKHVDKRPTAVRFHNTASFLPYIVPPLLFPQMQRAKHTLPQDLVTPPSSSNSQSAARAPQRSPPFVARNDLEAYFLDVLHLSPEDAKLAFPSEAGIDLVMRTPTNASDAERSRRRQLYHTIASKKLHNTERKPVIIGKKPVAGELDVHLVDIPDDTLAIRLWAGGMADQGIYLLDFFNVVEDMPVNTPNGYILSPIPTPGQFCPVSQLVSWEESMSSRFPEATAATRLQRGAEGTDRYSIMEGMGCQLTRPNREPFYFLIPTRPRPNWGGVQFATARSVGAS
ncbi:hypothetical protein QCA50_001326 [Cerrena zonata]|uniref:Uncharacterized protein n=1 Tax=Cerrena zonata TaxID=2478898 RepID=A0AAW0GL29_9APHY